MSNHQFLWGAVHGVMCLIIGGCGQVSEDDLALFLVEDSAGVELVRNLDGLSTENDEPLGIREVLRIGSVSGSPEYLLDLVGTIAIQADTIFVPLRRSTEIRVFDPEGQYVRTLGRSGEGPGEFAQLTSIFLVSDTVVAQDTRLQRTTLMDAEGNVLETWPRVSSSERSLRLRGRVPSGWLVEFIEQVWPGAGDTAEQRVALHAVSSVPDAMEAVRIRNTPFVASPLHLEYSWGRRVGLGNEGALIPVWEPRQEWAADGAGRIYLTATPQYRIDVFDPLGVLVRRVYREHLAVPITEGLRRQYLREAESYYASQNPSGASEGAAARGPMATARVRIDSSGSILPALGRILVSDGGSFLVERLDTADDPVAAVWTEGETQSARWDMFDSSGAFVGKLEMPDRFQLHVVGDNWIAGVTSDELGVQYVVRYAIDAP